MKNIFYVFLLIMISACGASKSETTTTAAPETPLIITESVIEITPQKQPQVEDNTVIEPEDILDDTANDDKLQVAITEPEVMPDVAGVDHSAFNSLLAKHVTAQGNVDYVSLKKDWNMLRSYIASLSETMPDDSWTQEEKLAYWMNAYNAMTIDLILRNYPIASIKDIKDPWDQRFWKLGDKWYNLNEIEHEILRKMGDARIHFGINCASFSCPPLLNEAFTAQKVDDQLNRLSQTFINDTSRNTITKDRVEVSKIFDWFAKDFKTDGSLIDFLNKYSDTEISTNAKVRYRDYDWTLNR